MNISLETESLRAALASLKPVTASKSALPILSGVLLRTIDSELTLTATNLDIRLCVTLDCDVRDGGAMILPCSLFSEAVKQFKDERCEVIIESGKAILRSGDMQAKLYGLPPDEFPQEIAIDAAEMSFEPGTLVRALARALPFVSEDETRYVLNGIHLAGDGKKLSIEATDGRRLAVETISSEFKADVIIGRDAAKRLVALGGEQEIAVATDGKQLSANGEGWRFRAKLIEGNYPNTVQVIPSAENRKCTVQIPKARVLNAINFADIISKRTDGGILIEASDGVLKLSASGPDLGEVEVRIENDHEGDPLAVRYHPKYLRDTLEYCPGETITLEMDSSSSPAVCEGNGCLAVIMPMRTE